MSTNEFGGDTLGASLTPRPDLRADARLAIAGVEYTQPTQYSGGKKRKGKDR